MTLFQMKFFPDLGIGFENVCTLYNVHSKFLHYTYTMFKKSTSDPVQKLSIPLTLSNILNSLFLCLFSFSLYSFVSVSYPQLSLIYPVSFP